MVGHFITELVEGSKVDSVFVLRAREMRATRTGEAYLALELADRTGSIPAVLFRPNSGACAIPSGSVVRATGTVTRFRGVRRISLDSMGAAEEWDPNDLIGSSSRPREELVRELKELVASVQATGLRRLLRAVFGDKEYFDRFCLCPASVDAHHAHIGGLLEHTVDVARACAGVADGYPQVDRDLLVTAALLHDIGVVDQLSYEAGISVTDRGRLIGPQALGLLRVDSAAARARLDGETLMRVEHAVLGRDSGADGSMTLETLLLLKIDELDGAAAAYSHRVSAAALVEERWAPAGNGALYAPSAA